MVLSNGDPTRHSYGGRDNPVQDTPIRQSETNNGLKAKACRIRSNCIKMSYEAKEGHLGSALSCVDILVALFEHFDFRPFVDGKGTKHPDRDRLFFSKGHACSALYAAYAEYGFIDLSELSTYAQPGTRLLPHPDKLALPLLEMSAGSLGHGLGYACGVAYALKQRGSKAKCIVLMGDGECNEGSVWEAAQFAAAHKLDNLLVVVDYNGIQSIGLTDEISGGTSLTQKFRAFGWSANDVFGFSYSEIELGMIGTFESDKPKAFIAETDSGVSFINYTDCLWHYRIPDESEYQAAMLELKPQKGDLSKDA